MASEMDWKEVSVFPIQKTIRHPALYICRRTAQLLRSFALTPVTEIVILMLIISDSNPTWPSATRILYEIQTRMMRL